jgi:N,N'-diacetyllegionaminate synthase
MKTLIIAEAGVNHNGNLDMARRLIDVAADAGADVIKFQTFSADKLVTSTAAKAKYQQQASATCETQAMMLKRLELTREMHEQLMMYCREREITFFSTAFDRASLCFLAELGLDYFKVPSGELTNLPYLRHMGSYGKPVFLSTGMARLCEIEHALHVLEQAGTSRDKITVLHCNTAYPTPMCDVHLRAMSYLRDSLGVKVGYSDHTLGIEVAIAAVALGAVVIEKHITLDRTLPGPDHQASIEPHELQALVRGIRNIEIALGEARKEPTSSELENIAVARKSLVAFKVIDEGELFTSDNLTAKRPGTGLSPMLWDDMIGKKAKRSYLPDELIEA